MAKKEELFEKETKYCKVIKSDTLVDGEETFALEKLYIKSDGKNLLQSLSLLS